jgi:RNA polymerase sigma factor (sigma-70 family)
MLRVDLERRNRLRRETEPDSGLEGMRSGRDHMRLLPATPERRREEHGPEPLTARDLGWADGIRSGDGAAFERLFKTYYATLCHFARTYVRGEDECREVVQEVFLRIWEKRQVWHPSHSVRMYLYRAVRNKALNHVRYQRMRGHAAVFGEEDGPEPSLSGEQDVLERIDSEEPSICCTARTGLRTPRSPRSWAPRPRRWQIRSARRCTSSVAGSRTI